MGRTGKGRVEPPYHGIFLLDKDPGPSSNRALQKVRRNLGGAKAGHAGTLDPQAGGLLLIGLGEGTKLIPFLAPLHKEYLAEMRFGTATDTHDAWGNTVRGAPVEHLERRLIEEGMESFVGSGTQVPPMFSAVKIGGERLYRKARRGEEVPRPARRVEVMEFALLRWDPPRLEFRVRCGGGTYIRTLCHDLGELCGSAGHMTALRRNAVGPFRVDDALTLAELAAVAPGDTVPIVPPAASLPHLPALRVDDEEAGRVRHGLPPSPPSGELADGLDVGQEVRLIAPGDDLVAVAAVSGRFMPMIIRRVFRRLDPPQAANSREL